jgi:flagellar hook-length control protein FliK
MDTAQVADQLDVETVDAQANAEVIAVSTAPVTNWRDSLAKDSNQPEASTLSEIGKGVDAMVLADPDVLAEISEGKKWLHKDSLDEFASATLPGADTLAVATNATLDALTAIALPIADAATIKTQATLEAAALLPQAAQWSSLSVQSSQSESQNPVSIAAQVGAVGAKFAYDVVKPEGASAEPFALNILLETPGKAGKLSRESAAKQALTGDGLTAKPASVGQPESRALPIAAMSIEQSSVANAVPIVLPSSMGLVRREDTARERSVFRSNATEGSALGQSFQSISTSTAVQYTPELQMSPEVYVAEKVAYWISNDVQNAEMKLDGIGLDPVEVSIRMHGNEAHVAFRTDELQARAALENASTHLKELLQREGLVLTGVSVGTAGAGDSGGGDGDGNSRQGSRQRTISAIAPPSARSGPVAGRSAGGRLDLFV